MSESQKLVLNPKNLQAEIKRLESLLKFPAKFKGLVGGFLAGYLLAGDDPTTKALSAGAMGLGGYALSKELTEDQRVAISARLQTLRERLSEHKGMNLPDDTMMSGEEIMDVKFAKLDFSGEWQDFIGLPSKNFHAIVSGLPKSGKSIFCIQFADYLSLNFGKSLYIACEEGFGDTLKEKIRDWAGGGNSSLTFGNYKGYDKIKEACRGFDFVFIDSVNYAGIEVSELEELKTIYPQCAFITIFQSNKQGEMRGSQEYAHNCDIVIVVEDGIAYQQGRFNPGSQLEIFNRKD